MTFLALWIAYALIACGLCIVRLPPRLLSTPVRLPALIVDCTHTLHALLPFLGCYFQTQGPPY